MDDGERALTTRRLSITLLIQVKEGGCDHVIIYPLDGPIKYTLNKSVKR